MNDKEILKMAEEGLENCRDWMLELRHHLHRHPELSDEEKETTAYLEKELNAMGIRTQRLLDTGLVGILDAPEGLSGGKCIALRADIDALPIQEETDLEFRSVNDGVMHACGHDMHMAALMGTARILSSPEFRSRLTAPVKFFLQPAEETDGGADRMIKAGCLENPGVDHVIGCHVAPENLAGQIATKHGYTHASSDMFEVKVHGVKSHGAYPSEGVDAITAAAQIVTALQTITSRNVEATEPCVITIGKLHAGTAGNIVCDLAEMAGTIRITSAATRQTVLRRVEEICTGVARAMGARAEVKFKPGYISQHNDDFTVDIVNEAAAAVVGPENVLIRDNPVMSVEDFAFYAAERPSAFFFLGTGYPDRVNFGLHHERFEADESALDVAVKTEVLSIIKLMNS